MDKAAIICQVHKITDYYLLGPGTWPLDRDLLPAFLKTMRELGLDEDVPDSPGTTQSTSLGKELKLDLLMAFVGAWDIWEIPYILEANGFLEVPEAEELYNGPPLEAERKIRWYVLRAYLKFF
jgi:hypothetical protein